MNTKIVFSRPRYKALLAQLAARGHGSRESGAFLLASKTARPILGGMEVTHVAYYDDVDPGSLTGGITMHAVGFTTLNALCRERGLVVVGDIHTHPSSWVNQSDIDSTHPMIAFPGHIALIAPRYAQGNPQTEALGAHRFLGKGRWQHYFDEDTAKAIVVASLPRLIWERFARRERKTT